MLFVSYLMFRHSQRLNCFPSCVPAFPITNYTCALSDMHISTTPAADKPSHTHTFPSKEVAHLTRTTTKLIQVGGSRACPLILPILCVPIKRKPVLSVRYLHCHTSFKGSSSHPQTSQNYARMKNILLR